MESKMIYARGSSTVLGNTPFSEKLATASALQDTEERLNEIENIVSDMRSLSREWEDKFLMKGTVSAITGNYATHEEVLDSATATSANAYGILHDEIETVSGRLADGISTKAEMNTLISVSGELSGMYNEITESTIPNAVSSLEAIIQNEANARQQNDNSIVRLVELTSGTLQDHIDTVSGNVMQVNSNLNGRISELSATNKQRMDGISQTITNNKNEIDTWISNGVISTSPRMVNNPPRFQVGQIGGSSDLWVYGNVYATSAMTVDKDFESRGRFNTSAIDQDSMTGVLFKKPILVLGQMNGIEIGSGCISVFDNYQLGDYNHVYAASIAAGGDNSSTLGSIAVGYGCSASNHSISVGSYCKSSYYGAAFGTNVTAGKNSFAFNATNDNYLAPKTSFSVYVPQYISGVYINGNNLYQIFREYTVTNEEADQKIESAVNQNVSRTSGTIISSAAKIVSGTYLPSLKSELITQIDNEHDSRIVDVSSVRAELQNYIPLSGGVVYGDLDVKDIDIMTVYSGNHDIEFNITKDASHIKVHTFDMNLVCNEIKEYYGGDTSAAHASAIQLLWDYSLPDTVQYYVPRAVFIVSEDTEDGRDSYSCSAELWGTFEDSEHNFPTLQILYLENAETYYDMSIAGVDDNGIVWHGGSEGIAAFSEAALATYQYEGADKPFVNTLISHFNDYNITPPASSFVQQSDMLPPRFSDTSMLNDYSPVMYAANVKYDEYVPSSVTGHLTESLKSVTLYHPISVLEKLAHNNCLPNYLNIRVDFSDEYGNIVSRKAEFARNETTAYAYNRRNFDDEVNHLSADITMEYVGGPIEDVYGNAQDIVVILSATSSMENGSPVYRYVDSVLVHGHFYQEDTQQIDTMDWTCTLPLSNNKTINMFIDEQDSLMDELRETDRKIDEIDSALSATKNTLSYAIPTVDGDSYALEPSTSVYRVDAIMDGTSATIPDVDDSSIPTGGMYYCFEVEATIPDSATTLIGPSGWEWLEDGELPEYSGDFQGKTICISCRLDCAVNSRTILANVWRIK